MRLKLHTDTHKDLHYVIGFPSPWREIAAVRVVMKSPKFIVLGDVNTDMDSVSNALN